MPRRSLVVLLALGLATGSFLSATLSARAADALRVGFAENDITPDVAGKKPVWVAGYGQNRKATGVHDPLMTRALVLESGGQKIALVSADVVGLQYPTVKQIRAKLEGYAYVMVQATHNHEGPDTMGLWGPNPFKSGVDPEYMTRLIDQSVDAVKKAEANLATATAAYGTATDDAALRDSRLPQVADGVLRAIKFTSPQGAAPLVILVQWNCHPEAMGGSNTEITADFIATTITRLKEKYKCPIAYFTGAVGGLMAPPRGIYKDAQGNELKEGDFAYCEKYGEVVAELAVKAIDAVQPLALTPFVVSAKPITVPLENPLYMVARSTGILKRDGHAWTGDFEEVGEVLTAKSLAAAKAKDAGEKKEEIQAAASTEVAYLRLGELHVACIPGEIYPETVYGQYPDPVEANVDFPEAALEPPVMKTLPGPKTLLLGLANDELGYIVPKRQWDVAPPFAYGRKDAQYGEENSCGPEVAPILMQALVNRVRDAASQAAK